MFFDEQGIPILKMALKRMLLAEALPVPFSVAIQMLRSLIAGDSISELHPSFRVDHAPED